MNSEWIDVNERLPAHQQTVIVWFDGEAHEAECWRGNSGTRKYPTWDAPYYGQDLVVSFENVTHWMPMPKQPQ